MLELEEVRLHQHQGVGFIFVLKGQVGSKGWLGDRNFWMPVIRSISIRGCLMGAGVQGTKSCSALVGYSGVESFADEIYGCLSLLIAVVALALVIAAASKRVCTTG